MAASESSLQDQVELTKKYHAEVAGFRDIESQRHRYRQSKDDTDSQTKQKEIDSLHAHVKSYQTNLESVKNDNKELLNHYENFKQKYHQPKQTIHYDVQYSSNKTSSAAVVAPQGQVAPPPQRQTHKTSTSITTTQSAQQFLPPEIVPPPPPPIAVRNRTGPTQHYNEIKTPPSESARREEIETVAQCPLETVVDKLQSEESTNSNKPLMPKILFPWALNPATQPEHTKSIDNMTNQKPQQQQHTTQQQQLLPTNIQRNDRHHSDSSSNGSHRGKDRFNPKLEAEYIKFSSLPQVPQWRTWKMDAMKIVASTSGRPERAIIWISQFETSKSWEDLENSGDTWATLDIKIAAALTKILHGTFVSRIRLIEQTLANQTPKRMLKGRQMFWLLEDHFKLHSTEGQALEWEDILYVELTGDNIEGFLNKWETTLSNLQYCDISDTQLGSLLRRQLERAPELEMILSLYTLTCQIHPEHRTHGNSIYQVRAYLQ